MSEAYQVIARRWRPKQFTELVGQEHIVRTLSNAIEIGRIAHAYLFVGPRGTGKTTTARLFAKSLNWEEGPSIETPESTEICDSIMRGECLDVIEIDGASNNGVEQVRALRDECIYAPVQCRFKIYIIDEVHMLSTAAFNALLKTLEEPPAHVKFIFATTESHKVLPTITSRCQRFEFRSIPDDIIAQKLQVISKAEEIEVSEDALKIIARIADGGMRDAQSTLDQLIAFCGKKISKEDVLDVYGLVDPERVEQLAEIMIAGDYSSLLESVSIISDEGRDLYRLLRDLRDLFRKKLVDSVGDEKEGSSDALSRMLDVLQSGEAHVQGGLSQLVNFEATLLKAVEQGRTRAIDTLIKEISQMSRTLPPSEEVKKKLKQSEPRKVAPLKAYSGKSRIVVEAVPPPAKGEVVAEQPSEEAPDNFGEDTTDYSKEASSALPEEVAPAEIKMRSLKAPSAPSRGKITKEVEARVAKLDKEFLEFLDLKFRAHFIDLKEMKPEFELKKK